MTNWARLRTLSLTTGLVIVGIGVIFMLVGTFYNISNFIEAAKWVLSMGLGITSLGIAFHSIVISEESRKIAGESDEKMIANTNESFLKIVDTFEDKRIQLLQHPEWLGIEGTIWKCQTYLDRAIKLKKSAKIDIDNQNKLFDQFDVLINRTGLPWGTDAIKPSDFGNIQEMETKFLELDLTDESKEKLKRIKEYIKKFEKKKKGK
jgi:hypothetical protein